MNEPKSTAEQQSLRDVNLPFYNYLQALVLSFFSRLLYVDVGKRWRGLGVLYLLFVVVVTVIPFAVRVTINFNNNLSGQVIEPLEKLPPIEIQNGQVSFNKPMPYVIKDSKGREVIIVDTTGTITNITNAYPNLSILITKDKFFYRMPAPQYFFNGQKAATNPVYMQSLQDMPNQVFNAEQWVKSSGISNVKLLSEIIIYPMLVSLFFSIYLVFFLVFALMGQFMARLFFYFPLTYAQTSRLLIVSSTVQIVVLMLSLAFNIMFPGFGLILLGLMTIYFCFAVWALKRESYKLVVS